MPGKEVISDVEEWEHAFDFKACDELDAQAAELFTKDGLTGADLHKAALALRDVGASGQHAIEVVCPDA